ncbi:TetR family transcriptional regulator [Kribbella amoyensis]|uniref:TetR family transcriptional regulator n=1 Tax=Kribbella amoyensis TaxID=996641 RepID=A0A561BYA8_9ACTN|nr:TetR/AcrR family transcriptional regulator [Kribbella amoyensis]TWD83876.1 TetR family transcriptional regulator [Kribbella amoyensis]
MPDRLTGPAVGKTRDRLLTAGLRLFAEHDFHSVRVGDIEEAAGLVPRRGAMYRHFASKDALLEAAVEAHLQSVAAAGLQYQGDGERPVASTGEVGALILAEMDRQQLITLVLERNGHRLPALRDRFRAGVSDAGYRTMRNLLTAWLSAARPTAEPRFVDGLAVHLLGAMVNARRSTWTLGAPPLGLTDAELIAGWVALCDGWLAGGRPDQT